MRIPLINFCGQKVWQDSETKMFHCSAFSEGCEDVESLQEEIEEMLLQREEDKNHYRETEGELDYRSPYEIRQQELIETWNDFNRGERDV